jgi:hypothetical protein
MNTRVIYANKFILKIKRKVNKMTNQEFEKATEGITYKIVESMEQTEIVNHTEDYHLYKYSHDSECCDDDGSIVVLKENDTDEEIAVVLLDKDEQLLFDMLID